MAFVVLYDANVLYPNTLRDLLIRIGQSGIVQAKWTDQILDEVFRNLSVNRPDIAPEKHAVVRGLMNASIADVLVAEYEPLIDALSLPDKDDRHVLAAAIKCKAQALVTDNVKDFPRDVLATWDIEPKRPDDFVLDQIDIDARVVYACVQQIVDSRTRRPETIEDVLAQLERSGLVDSAAALRSR
jgi:predicted nucleic acid-binding protein